MCEIDKDQFRISISKNTFPFCIHPSAYNLNLKSDQKLIIAED